MSVRAVWRLQSVNKRLHSARNTQLWQFYTGNWLTVDLFASVI